MKYLTYFDNVQLPEPDNLFDDFSGRGTAAKEANMRMESMQMGWYCQLWTERKGERDIYNDYGDRLWERAYGRLNNEQKAAIDQAYNKKNEAFVKANLKGKDLVRWKYQRTMKNYLGCIKSVDDNVGRLMRNNFV